MRFAEGQEVIVVQAWDGTVPNRKGKVVKDRPERDEIRVDDEWYYRAFVFPVSAEQEIHAVQMQRAKLKQALDDSMKLVYELANKRSRGEFK